MAPMKSSLRLGEIRLMAGRNRPSGGCGVPAGRIEKFLGVIVLRACASPRDAVPTTLRLPRRCAPRNDTELERFNLENGRFWMDADVFDANQRSVFQ